MTQQIPDIDSLQLALSNDMQASISRVRLMRSMEKKSLAVLVYGGPFDEGPFFMYFSR